MKKANSRSLGHSMTTKSESHCFRAFLSYSHDDFEIAEWVAAVLCECNVIPVWDQHLRPGERFSDAIKDMIGSAHLFIPLLTPKSLQGAWVLQETGYATALNIPVLPLAQGVIDKDTIVRELQAVVFKDIDELREKLKQTNFGRLVRPELSLPKQICHEAYWPEERTDLIAKYTNLVLNIRGSAAPACKDRPQVRSSGKLLQAGALSSFCLPDEDLGSPVWTRRDGDQVRSDYYHHLQREERRALERYARLEGCRLVLYLGQTYSGRGDEIQARTVRYSRLKTLVESLQSMRDGGCNLEVVVSDVPHDGNLTIVGDWFLAESLLPGVGGYRQTLFKWHAPTVFQRIEQFNQRFEELRDRKPRKTLAQIIRNIETILKSLKSAGLTPEDGKSPKPKLSARKR